MNRFGRTVGVLVAALAAASAASAAPPQATQSDAAFADSYSGEGCRQRLGDDAADQLLRAEVPYRTALTAGTAIRAAARPPARARRPESRRAASRRRTSRTRPCSSRTTPSPTSASTRPTRRT